MGTTNVISVKVFFPLVDITAENGPTELRPGSHFLSRDLARFTLIAKANLCLIWL